MKQKRILYPTLTALLVFILLYGAILFFNTTHNRNYRILERNQVGDLLNGRQAILESNLNLRLGIAYSMAAFASANPDRLGDTFPAYAAQLYDLTPDVRSIQIAPDGILTYIYPLAGNEEALGLDLANHPDRRESFERTVHRNTLSLSGPFELVQGGLGLVGQIPILSDGDFWGVGVVVIDVPPLLVEAGILEAGGDIAYAARSIDGDGNIYAAFIGNDDLFANPTASDTAVFATIPLPDGYWELAARPAAGWQTSAPESPIILGGGFVVVFILSVAAFSVIQTNIDNRRLLAKELRQRQIAQSLQTIAIDLNSDLDERQLLQNILQQLAQVIRYDSSGLLLTDGNDLTLREEIGFDAPNLAEFRISLSDTAAPEIKVMTQAEAIMVADVSINLAWRNWTTETAVGAWMSAPLLVNQKSIGVLTVHEHTPNVYAAEDLTTLQAFANQAATALNNARLLKETHSAREIAESANRAKSAFLAAMSHELRTPLNGVLGYAQILQNNNQLAPEQRRGLEVIERSGNHLLNLINEVLDLAKIESGRFELESISFDLPDLLANVVSFFEVRARHKGVQLQYTAANIPNHVRGDAKRLRQILLNILGNAVKFTETGQVKLEVTMSSGTAVPSPNIIPLCFSITDSGSGIPAANLGSVFEPFQQAGSLSQRSQGTGLGLSISRNLLTMMDSHLYVMSKTAVGNWATTAPEMPSPPPIEHGSRFWFYLPLQLSGKASEGRSYASRIVGYQGDPIKILIVDDNHDNRAVLAGLLEPLGFLIREAEDGQEGLMTAVSWQPHLILTDLVMPKLDGFSLIRQIRQLPAFTDTIIIAASASVMEADVQHSLEIGSNSFLPKPIQADRLYQQLESLLQLKWVHEKRPSRQPAATSAEIIFPPTDLLNQLHTAAEQGNMTAVLQHIQHLEQSNAADYHAFIQHTRQFTNEFRLDELAEWLKRSQS